MDFLPYLETHEKVQGVSGRERAGEAACQETHPGAAARIGRHGVESCGCGADGEAPRARGSGSGVRLTAKAKPKPKAKAAPKDGAAELLAKEVLGAIYQFVPPDSLTPEANAVLHERLTAALKAFKKAR